MAPSTSPSLLTRVLGAALAAVVAVAGFVLMAAALLFGLVVAAVIWIWALLRGGPRSATFKVYRGGFPRRGRGTAGRGGGSGGGSASSDDVIDGAVREVPDRIDRSENGQR